MPEALKQLDRATTRRKSARSPSLVPIQKLLSAGKHRAGHRDRVIGRCRTLGLVARNLNAGGEEARFSHEVVESGRIGKYRHLTGW